MIKKKSTNLELIQKISELEAKLSKTQWLNEKEHIIDTELYMPFYGDVATLNTNIAKAKNILIDYSILNPITVFADKDMIHTIFRNLISNEIKFTHQGGKINISATQDNKETLIKISDNGIGMNSDILNRLFKIEEKVSRKGTNQESGTGLGLLLCKEFVEKHRGEIWAECEENKGTTFFFTIPKNN